MTPFLAIFVPCVPVAQPRARAGVINGHARVFNPSSVKTATGTKPHPVVEFKHALRLMVMASPSCRKLEGPVRSDEFFIMPRPKTKPPWLSREKWKSGGRYHHIGKPDRDNLEKAVLDALKGILWSDDSLVCLGRIEKWVAAVGEQPGVRIEVTDLKEAAC